MPLVVDGVSTLAQASPLQEELRAERDQKLREMQEISILIRQTMTEVDRLSERHQQAEDRVREMESSIDRYPRSEISALYNAFHESALRLIVMKSQLEQFQAKEESLKLYVKRIEQFLQVAGQLPASTEETPGEALAETATPAEPIDEAQAILKIIQAQEDERQRLSRQMHDGPVQSLTNLILQAEICERLLDSDTARARQELAQLKKMVNATFQRTRRFIFDLRPMMLDDLGLVPTLRKYIQSFQEENKIAIQLNAQGQEHRFPPHIEVPLFRAVQELLTNVSKHARATQVTVTLQIQKERINVIIEDNGIGMDADAVLRAARQRKTLGLANVLERIESLHGHLRIQSTPGQGTSITIEVPTRGGET